MARAQAIVIKDMQILMVKHEDAQTEWWCLPGGGIEENETPKECVIRELYEECQVNGNIIRQTSHSLHDDGFQNYTYYVDIGNEQPTLGFDPNELSKDYRLVDVKWMKLEEIPERDRAHLWASGLIGVSDFSKVVETWGNEISFPKGP